MGLLTTLSLGMALAVFPCVAALPCAAQQKIVIPTAPPAQAAPQGFKDGHFGVKFQVPAGWSLNRKDGLVSTFHNDARSATPDARVRGIASLDFNPYPYSTLSGAVFYLQRDASHERSGMRQGGRAGGGAGDRVDRCTGHRRHAIHAWA